MKQFLLFIGALLISNSCTTESAYIKNTGKIYGTFYNIQYESPYGKNLQIEIEAELHNLTMSFSTFEKESVISKVNTNEEVLLDHYFINCFEKAQEVSQTTNGAFDISVAPLVNAWGFGFKHKELITSKLIDSLLLITGFEKVKLENNTIIKEFPEMMLDMSAIAKGYTCDLIGNLLAQKGCKNFLVEIGGEVVAKGVNKKGKSWTIGISKPDDNAFFANQQLQAIIGLQNKAMATSGNYRNFYVENGKKYAHTIDPKSGYPVQHSLLSATVLADDCQTADAYATAFMVMGLEQSILLSQQIPGIEVYFIYSENGSENEIYFSENFENLIK